MSNNPSLSVEFKAINENPVVQSIDRVTRAGERYSQSYIDWLNNLSRAERRHTQVTVEETSRRARMANAEADELIRNGERIIAMRQRQLAMESRVANSGGYGPQMPTAPTVAPDRAASVINAGMVNAAAFLTVATQAYNMASRAVGVISGFVMDAAKWEAMDMGLRNMEGSARGAANATEKLYEIAKAPGIELATATKAYLQLRSLHMAGSDAERTIKAISNTIARGGGGSVEFERVLRQLTQMLSKGKVLEQDLRIMKEAMPELASLMQKAFGETTAEGIRKSGVNAKQFVETMLTEMEKLPKAQQTLTSEIENTQVAWSRLKAAFVDTEWTKKFLSDITKMLEGATSLINAKSIDWKKLISGSFSNLKNYEFSDLLVGGVVGKLISGGLKSGAGMSGKDVDIKNVNDFFDKATKYKSVKAGNGFQYQKVDADGKTREDWLAFVEKKWAAPPAPNSEGVATSKSSAAENKRGSKNNTEKDLGWNDPKRVANAKAYSENLAKIEKERRERSAKEFNEAREQSRKEMIAELAAMKSHQANVDAWNQAQIDKNREKNQAGNAYLAKFNKYDNIDFEFEAENDKIVDLFKNNEEAMTRALELNLAKRSQLRRDAEAADLTQFTTGSSQLANSLAENIKAGIDYSYEAKRKSIEREYALAESAGTATTELRKKKDSALAALDEKRESDMKGSYATMFRIVKGFEIATASVQLAAAMLQALNDKTAVTTYQKLANVGLVMAAGGNLISQITSAQYSGYFDKGGNIPVGKWGIAGENGPEIIQGPAHVTSTRDTARLLGSANNGGNITVNNYAGASVSASKNASGDWEILIQRAAEVAEDRIASGIASGGGKVGRQISNTFGVKR